MASVVLSEKNKSLIVVEGYTFCFHKMLAKDTLKRWQCTKRTCKAFLKTNCIGEEVIINSVLDHNHEKLSEEVLNVRQLNNSVKRAAVSDICEKPLKLLRKEIRNMEIDTVTTKDMAKIGKNVRRIRLSHGVFKTPKNIAEFHQSIESAPIVTDKKENFLLKNDKDNNIIIFSCETNLRFLSSCPHVYVDGTFQYCPKHFLQLFTIHGLKYDNYIPLVFCLLPNKLSFSYQLLFQYLKEACANLNSPLVPETITADFEIAIHKAIAKSFKNTSIRGCKFHLGQSWYRKIQAVGLSSAYQNKSGQNDEISKFLSYMFGLSFLHPADVGDVYAFNLAEIQPKNDKVTEFCDYLVEHYIDDNSTFPPRIWAEHSESIQRTTNACESFHSHYNGSFYFSHPDINKFLNVLLDFQADTYRKMNSVHVVNKIHSKTLNKQNFIKKLIEDLAENKIDKFEFVKSISYRCKPKVNL